MNTFAIDEANKLIGRVFKAADGLVYTAVSCSTNGSVTVYDPRKDEFISFDNRKTYENWAFGAPVSSAAEPDEDYRNGKPRPPVSYVLEPPSTHPLAKWMDEHGTENVPASLIGVICDVIADAQHTPNMSVCPICGTHQSDCICADCSGAELTADND